MTGLATVLRILAGFAGCAVASMSLGLAVLRKLRLDLRRAEAIGLAYLVGSALTSTLTFAVAAAQIAWSELFVFLSLAALILLWRQRAWLRTLEPARFSDTEIGLSALVCAALIGYGLLYFRQALSPEMSPDGMAYHLGLVNLWNHSHGLTRGIGMYSALPEGMEMLFLFAFSIGGHSAAALVHFSFPIALGFLMVLFGMRFGWPRAAGIVAAVILFSSPLVGIDATSAYNDVAVAAVIFGAVFLFEIWRRDRASSGCLYAASLLAGFAVAVKPTAVFPSAFLLAFAAWELRRGKEPRAVRALLISTLIVAAIPAPYFIRNAIWFQNPAGFLGNSLFPNRSFHVSFERSYTRSLAQIPESAWREMPRELGPVFLLAPLAVAGLIFPQTRLLAIAAMAAALPFLAVRSTRFLIPALPFVTMAAAYVLCRLPRGSLLAGALACVNLYLCLPAVSNRWHIGGGWRLYYHVPWRVALRLEPAERYLERSDEYRMARLIEAQVPAGEKVLSLDAAVAQSYTARTVLVAWESAFAERMTDMILSAGYATTQGTRTWTARWPPAEVKEVRIAQAGTSATEAMWSVNEIRLSSEGLALERSPRWRLEAQPNPWDIALAFDGSAATRWRSWETLRPGMRIGVAFDRPIRLDTVEVDCADPQWESRMTASVRTAGGQWLSAGESLWRDTRVPPGLRRQATGEVKRSGVRYIEMNSDAWRQEPFHADGAGWGVSEVATNQRSVLLRID